MPINGHFEVATVTNFQGAFPPENSHFVYSNGLAI